MERNCCSPECEAPAVFEVWALVPDNPYDHTDVCHIHAGELMFRDDCANFNVARINP